MSLEDELRDILGKDEVSPEEALQMIAKIVTTYYQSLIHAGIPQSLAETLTVNLQTEFLATGLRK